MNFDIPEDLKQLQQRVRAFIADEIVPTEDDPRQGPHGPEESLRRELIAKARAAGLLSPHVSREYGGLGLDHRGKAIVFEEAGYSPLRPVALNTQVRLAPARLTHCMRWLGAVRRAHDVAVDYARRRQAFGKALAQHEGVGFMLADNELDLHVTRLAIWHCAWVLDQGGLGLHASSQTRVIASEAIWCIADRCVQVLGGQGVTHETVVARIFADVRAFRIYDGPSEMHRWSLAKRIFKGHEGRS